VTVVHAVVTWTRAASTVASRISAARIRAEVALLAWRWLSVMSSMTAATPVRRAIARRAAVS
jgi:hypothetical protein